MSAEDADSNLVGTSFSLVRYNNPVLIDKKQEGSNSPNLKHNS
jgi:hypothetical protein